MENLVKQESKVSLANLDQWVLQETRVQWETRVKKDLLVCQDHKVQEVTLAKMEPQVYQVHQDKLVQQEREVWLDHLDPEDSKECL